MRRAGHGLEVEPQVAGVRVALVRPHDNLTLWTRSEAGHWVRYGGREKRAWADLRDLGRLEYAISAAEMGRLVTFGAHALSGGQFWVCISASGTGRWLRCDGITTVIVEWPELSSGERDVILLHPGAYQSHKESL